MKRINCNTDNELEDVLLRLTNNQIKFITESQLGWTIFYTGELKK